MQQILPEIGTPRSKSRPEPNQTIAARLGSLWPEWLTFSLYAAVVAYAIPYHEPFVDEAQAWQLARSLSLPTLFEKYIRYEGSPGLWHFLLWLLIRIHVSYAGLHWICGAIAVAATSLFIFRSPFPRYLKLTFPFTYFLVFQYAVIARNYVLAPLLLYAIALCWKKRPVLIAVLLGLLANVALHAAVISGGLAIAYCIAHRRRNFWAGPGFWREGVPSTLILLGFYAFSIWTAWPAPDLTLSRAMGGPHSFFLYAIVSLVGIFQPWLLAIPFWIAIALCLNARHGLFYLLPVALFACFSGVATANFWHMGLMVPLVICLFWITWPKQERKISRCEIGGLVALAVLAGIQILWAGYAISYDHFHSYWPDRETAQFLKPLLRNGGTVGLTYMQNPEDHAFPGDGQDYDYLSVGLLPYFNHNIFANQPYSFWWWSTNDSTEAQFLKLLPSRPRIIVVEVVKSTPSPLNFNNAKANLLTSSGYRLSNVFCGIMPERLSLAQTGCHLIYQYHGAPKDSPPLTSATGSAARHGHKIG